MNEQKIDAVYVSCPPHSASLIGDELKKKYNIPLILDFRDAWTLNPYTTYCCNYVKNRDEKIEQRVMKNTDLLICATNTIAKAYADKYPQIKISVIPNGFELHEIRQRKKSKKFTFLHVGDMYQGRSPQIFLQALQGTIYKGKFIGQTRSTINKMIMGYQLESQITLMGYQSRKKVFSIMRESSLLILIEHTDSVTTKIYEYLATGIPILAITKSHEIISLIKKYSPQSFVVMDNDVLKIQMAMNQAYLAWKKGESGVANSKYLQQYNRKSQTKMLAQVLRAGLELK